MVKWAKAMNEPIDPILVEEVEQYDRIQKDIVASVRTNSIKDIVDASIVAEKFVEKINIEYPKPPTLEEVLALLHEQEEVVPDPNVIENQVTVVPEQVITHVEEAQEEQSPIQEVEPEVVEDKSAKTLAELAANFITKEVGLEKRSVTPQPAADPLLLERNITELAKKIRFLEQTIGNLVMQGGPGGGSVKILDNDDVEFKRLTEVTENAVLIFDTTKKKFVARDLVEFIQGIQTGVEVQYNKLIDVDGNYTYIGEADPGTSPSLNKWRIKRVEQVGADINILWASGSSDFNKIWIDRLTYVYS